MRTLSSAVLVAFAFPLAAQGMTWGLTGGAALGSPEDVYSVAAASSVGGWSVGLAAGPRVPFGALALRIDASYSDLKNSASLVNNPNNPNNPLGGGGSATYRSTYDIAGASADVVWNVLGAGRTTSPYLLAGGGWYAVRTTISAPGDVPTQSTSGSLSYNGGLGFRFTRYFIEARAIVIGNVRQPVGERASLYSYPVTVGIWF